jgi:hypothetical protein
MNKLDTDITPVVFRVWRERESERTSVLALFPTIEWGPGMCSSYEHVGQHSGADYAGCIARTRPAKPAEYAALKRELTQRGYNLRVYARKPVFS